MAIAPSIVLSRACTALSLFVVGRPHPAFASAARFFAGRGRLGPPPITCSFAHHARPRCRSAILPTFVGCKSFAAAQRAMSTSLGASNEGLSDIGQPSNNSNNNSDDTTNKMPSWKERIDVSIAKSRKIRGSNYVQISTVDYGAMEPRCRTVVFRGFLKGAPVDAVREVLSGGGTAGEGGDAEAESGYDCVMKMITDKRSSKVKELEGYHASERRGGGNTAEMVWWFPKSSEQYRIRGRLQYVGSDGPLFSYADGTTGSDEVRNYLVAERKQQWGTLSDPARGQFYWKNPGIPYASTENDEENDVPSGGRDRDGKVLPPPDTFLLMLLYPSTIDYLRLGDNYRQIDEWEESCRWKSMRVNP